MNRGLLKYPGILSLFILISCMVSVGSPSLAGEPRHGISYFGNLKYPKDFPRFDYANPNAPKGGKVSSFIEGSFNNLHSYASKGIPAGWVGIIYDSLMKTSQDELSSAYGLMAESVELADDYTWVAFRLRDNAYWHDGVPVTVEDVLWTFRMIKTEASVGLKSAYKDVVRVEQTGPWSFRFHFSETAPKTRQLAMHVSGFTPLPKHYWQSRKFNATTLAPPLGSGAYRIKAVDPGHKMIYERVKNYWGKDLNVNIGHYNFDRIEILYFMDKNIAIQAQKAGVFDYYREQNEKDFITAYDSPGYRKGLFKKETYTLKMPYGMHWGIVLNSRKEKLRDIRVREALTLVYNFEWSNRVLQRGTEKRNNSFFMGSDMAATGLPSEAELALLAPFRDQIPARVFTQPAGVPENEPYGRNRNALVAADALLKAAGWVVRDFRRVNRKTGKPFSLEFLVFSTADIRQLTPYADNLKRLGIATRLRQVESNQITHQMRHFDFEATIRKYYSFRIPLAFMLRGFFLSENADKPNMENYAGIKDPVVDFLVEKIVAAASETELMTAGRALDRVLLWNFYLIPGSFPGGRHIVYWDRFGHPDLNQGINWTGFPYLWWFDKEKSARVDAGISAMGQDEEQ
ncbi:MAG: extracellular solute-binding protein [Desulfobacterales bacterium]